VDGCCDGVDCPPQLHRRHHGIGERLIIGLRFAFTDFWDDLVGPFIIGLMLAGLLAALVPDSFFSAFLGGGILSMLVMLAAGIPLYICATASTPIAAVLILKGVSPGAALVFLLVGPATNVAAVSVLLRSLGFRSTAIYLGTIAVCAVLSGLLVDGIYSTLGLSAQAVVGETVESIPHWMGVIGALVLLVLSFRSLWRRWSRQARATADQANLTPPPTAKLSPSCIAPQGDSKST
jgi:hypothetical protein